MKSESIKEIATALSKAQGQFDHAKKDVKNEFFKSKYADLASVIDAAKKPLSENGLSVAQVVDADENGNISLETILMHVSGEWISGKYPVRPVKTDPQAMGSAITYARRYAFSAITGIAADDDDGNAASQNGKNKSIDDKRSVDINADRDAWIKKIESQQNIDGLRALFSAFPSQLKAELTAIATSKSKTFAQKQEAA